jgi:hypothetical protein
MWASYGLALVGVGSIVGGDSKLSEAVRWGCGPFSVEGNQNGVSEEAGIGPLEVFVKDISVWAFGKDVTQRFQLSWRGYGHDSQLLDGDGQVQKNDKIVVRLDLGQLERSLRRDLRP